MVVTVAAVMVAMEEAMVAAVMVVATGVVTSVAAMAVTQSFCRRPPWRFSFQ